MKTSPYRAFSHDVTSAIWLYQNNKAAAMLVFQTNPFGVEPFSYVKTFFCSNKFAQPLTAWVKTLYRSDIHCKPEQKNVYRSVTMDTLYPGYKAYLVPSHLSCSSCRACYEVDWGRTTKRTLTLTLILLRTWVEFQVAGEQLHCKGSGCHLCRRCKIMDKKFFFFTIESKFLNALFWQILAKKRARLRERQIMVPLSTFCKIFYVWIFCSQIWDRVYRLLVSLACHFFFIFSTQSIRIRACLKDTRPSIK